jgi:hypothetical protein
MPAPSALYYNANALVRWEKLSPHQYRIYNLSNNATLFVTLTRIDGVKPEDQLLHAQFELPALDSRLVDIRYDPVTEMGGDGIYKLCARPVFRSVVSSTTIPSVIRQLSTITFPSLEAGENIVINTVEVNGLTVYNSSTDPVADFSNPLASLSAVVSGIQMMTGSGTVQYVAPNTTPIYPNLSPSIYPRLVVLGSGSAITSATYSDGIVSNADATIDVDCIWQVDDNVDQPLPTEYWVSEFNVAGVNILDRPYDLTIETGAFYAFLNTWLANNGGGFLDVDAANFAAYSFTCQNFESIVYAAYGSFEEDTLCDNIIELSDTYHCYNALINEKVCRDPCQKCTSDADKERARFLHDLSLLLQNGFIRLAAYDHLAYFGDFGYNERRISPTLDNVQFFKGLRRMLVKCGYDCSTPSKCGCSSC